MFCLIWQNKKLFYLIRNIYKLFGYVIGVVCMKIEAKSVVCEKRAKSVSDLLFILRKEMERTLKENNFSIITSYSAQHVFLVFVFD